MNGFRPPPQSTDSATAEMVPAHKAWKGSNVFLLQGKFIFGPDARSVFLTLFLIVAPAGVFCGFVAKKLMDDFSHHMGIAVMVVVVVFTIYDIILLLMTSGRDPGIIPRNTHPPEPESYNNDSSEIGQTPQLRLPRFKDVIVNGVSVKIKYCDTCMLYRPPRCSHCSICNNCVQNFDHHCPWVGQCIGKRNYRFFFMFVSSTTLLCLYVFAFCWVCIMKIKNSEHVSVWKAMSKTPASIALIVYTFIAVWFVGGLTVFHLYLIGTNQSTYENFRYRYDRRANPYNRGVIKNFSEVFCTSIPKSKNNFRAMVPKEPEIHPRMVGSAYVSRSMTKSAAETEMRSKLAYDDTSANEEEFSNDESVEFTPPQPDLNIHNRNENSDIRDAFYSRQTSVGRRSANWNLSPEVVSMASRLGDSNRIVRVDSSNRQ